MDAVIETLMRRYGITREQAELYAQQVRASDSPQDIRIRMESLQSVIEPQIERAKRIAYYNDVSGRFQRGEEITDDEYKYLQQVQEVDRKRVQQQAATMLAAKKLVGAATPAVNGLMAKIPQRDPWATPDEYRFSPDRFGQVLNETQRPERQPTGDHLYGVPQQTEGPWSRATPEQQLRLVMDRQFGTQAKPDVGLDIGPVKVTTPVDLEIGSARVHDPLPQLEEMYRRRVRNAGYWNRPENRQRSKELDDELFAERKRRRRD